jgi:hypothetical protein
LSHFGDPFTPTHDLPERAGRRPGMNRMPDPLWLAVVVVLCVRVSCTLAENDVAGALLQQAGQAASIPARVPHRADPYPAPEGAK